MHDPFFPFWIHVAKRKEGLGGKREKISTPLLRGLVWYAGIFRVPGENGLFTVKICAFGTGPSLVLL